MLFLERSVVEKTLTDGAEQATKPRPTVPEPKKVAAVAAKRKVSPNTPLQHGSRVLARGSL